MTSLPGLIESRAPLREVRRVQFGILSPDEINLCELYSNSQQVLKKCVSSTKKMTKHALYH
uniref:Uncharacterized protein n=1 Tax=Romanomermis culicivorax TaxID=13658 RepID=A0A915J5V5_ROMCU